MTNQRTSFVFVLAVAGLAASQSLSSLGLSQECQNTLSATLLGSDLSQCLNVGAAISIFTTTANTSIVQPVDTWLEGVCGTGPCSNSSLTQAAANITSGCQSDLSNIGISQQDAQDIANQIVQIYPTIRKIACLEDNNTSNHSLCVTELLNDIQNIIGPLSTNNLVSTVQSIISGNSNISIPKNVTCNDCTQAAWAIARQDIPSITQNSDLTGAISNECGADFLNGSQPSDIVTSSGSSTASPGAALGLRISYERFVTIAAVPLVGLLAGSTLLL